MTVTICLFLWTSQASVIPERVAMADSEDEDKVIFVSSKPGKMVIVEFFVLITI